MFFERPTFPLRKLDVLKDQKIYLWRSCWSFLQRVEIPWDSLIPIKNTLYYSIEFHCDALFITTVKNIIKKCV